MIIHCARCGKEFVKRKPNQIYCSRQCKFEQDNERYCRRQREETQAKKLPADPNDYMSQLARRRLNGEILCMWCGENFDGQPNQKFCCREHLNEFYNHLLNVRL